ncbi:MAG: hypothetical protein VW378_06635 [bacterium]
MKKNKLSKIPSEFKPYFRCLYRALFYMFFSLMFFFMTGLYFGRVSGRVVLFVGGSLILGLGVGFYLMYSEIKKIK